MTADIRDYLVEQQTPGWVKISVPIVTDDFKQPELQAWHRLRKLCNDMIGDKDNGR